MREKFPQLNDFSEQFLQSRTLEELLRIESTSLRIRDSVRQEKDIWLYPTMLPTLFRSELVNRLLSKNLAIFVKIASLIPYHQNMTIFFKPVPNSVKTPGFFCCIWEKWRIQNILNIRPFLAISEKIRTKFCCRFVQICTTAYNFTRPLLSYAAKELASSEHYYPI
jgi:hypothetical protein